MPERNPQARTFAAGPGRTIRQARDRAGAVDIPPSRVPFRAGGAESGLRAPQRWLLRECDCAESPGAPSCEGCAEQQVQRSVSELRPSRIPAGGPLGPSITSAIDASRGGGRPLERAARERMEVGLGESPGDIRVHADGYAAALARAVSARAFTVGSDLFFAAGAYRPGSRDGDKLIAHEVTHAVQQRGAVRSGPLSVSAPADAAEVEAEAMASTVQAEASAHPPKGSASAGGREPARTAGAMGVIRGAATSIARTVDPTSDDYQRGYNDGRAANPAAPGPLSPDALDDYNEGYQNGQAQADTAQASLPPATPASTASPPPDSAAPSTADQTGALSSTGATATEEPASHQVGGIPAFRYNLPSIPIAEAHIETAAASVDLALSLRGNVTVTFPNAPANVSTDVDTGGWRLQATQALGGLTAGLRINGIGTKTPSLGATLGTRFNQTEVRLIPPNTMAFIGQAIVGYSVPSPLGDVSVRGQPGFELRVTVTPRPGAGDSTEVVDEESWFSRHAQALAIIGAVSLAVAVAVVAITAAPATGGASLALLALE